MGGSGGEDKYRNRKATSEAIAMLQAGVGGGLDQQLWSQEL